MYILLDSVDKVQEFVNNIEKCEAEVDLISGRREVDAKSLLGIFSLDLTRPIEVRIQQGEDCEILTQMLYRFET